MIFSFSNYLIITLFLIQRTFQWVEKTYEPQPLLGLTQENPALDPLAVPYLDTQLCDKSVTKGNLPGFSYVRDFLHIITEWKLLASLNCDGLYYVQVQETTLNAGSISTISDIFTNFWGQDLNPLPLGKEGGTYEGFFKDPFSLGLVCQC